MNRAAFAARIFFAVAILPTAGAAGYAVYKYRHQPGAVLADGPAVNGAIVAHSSSTKGRILGAFAPTKRPTASDTSGLEAFEDAIHQKLTLTVAYLNWGSRFPAKYVTDANTLGARTLLELKPKGKGVASLPQIAAGREDRWLKRFAHNLVKTGIPITLSFGPEMNGPWYPYGSQNNTPQSYNEAFRRVHDELIKDVGQDLSGGRATRLIKFMWQPSAKRKTTPSPGPYWPGAKYVDLIGIDGYYYHWFDKFRMVFAPTIRLLRNKGIETTIMIGETAVGPMTGRQAAGIKDLFVGIKHYNLAGLIWYNEDQTKISYPAKLRIFHQDWHLQDHPRALRAFIAGLKADGPFARLWATPIGAGAQG
jgi:hypothetical protein